MRVVHLTTRHRALDVRIFHKECRTLAAAGYQVHVLAADPPGSCLDGVHFHRCRAPLAAFRPQRIARRLRRVYCQAAALGGDLYHFHDPELIPVGLLLKRTGARVVYDVHEDTPREALALNRHRPLEARLMSWAWSLLEGTARLGLDAFVCATPAIARTFRLHRTVTVQNFPRPDEFPARPPAEPPWAERPPQLVYVGGITRIRGIREMVRAVELLPETLDARLVLAGDFAPAALAAELQRQPGWRRVLHLGWQARAGVVATLAQARLGLVVLHPEPSYRDSLPTKLFEYMAAGLPVVASDFPPWRAIVAGARCGLLVDPLDPQAIARAVQQLLEQPAAAAAMGARGRQAVSQRYNWNAEAGKLLDLYRDLERCQPP